MARTANPPFPDCCNVAIHCLAGSRRGMPFYSKRIPVFSGNIPSLPGEDEVNEVQPGLMRAPDFPDERRGGQEVATGDITQNRRFPESIRLAE